MDLFQDMRLEYPIIAFDFFQLLMVALAFVMALPEYRRNNRGEYLYLLMGLGVLIAYFSTHTLLNSIEDSFYLSLPAVDLLGSFLEALGLIFVTYFFLIWILPNPITTLRWGRTMVMGIIGVTLFFAILQLMGLLEGIDDWGIVGRPVFRMIVVLIILFGLIQMVRGKKIPYRSLIGFIALFIAHLYHLFYYPDTYAASFLENIYPWPYLFNPIGYFFLVTAVDNKIAEDQTELATQLKRRREELESATANLMKLNRLSTNLLRTTDLRGIIRMILDSLNLDLGYRNSALFILDLETSSLRGFKISQLTGAPVSYPQIPITKKSFIVDCFLQAKPSFFGEGHSQANTDFIRDYEFSASIVTIPLLTKKEFLCHELKDCNLKSCPVKGWDLNICWMMTDERCPCYNPDENEKIANCLRCQSFNVVGMIVIDNRQLKIKSDDKNLAFLETFTNQAGLALQSAFLFDDLSKESVLRTETLKNLPVGIIVLNSNGKIREFNDAMAQIIEINASSSPIGSHYSSLKIFKDIHELGEKIQAILDGISSVQSAIISNQSINVGGKSKIVNVQLRPLLKNQILTGLIIMTEDITSTKELERQVIKSEALASMGQLAMGIAHEINNPIAGVSGVLQVIGQRYADDTTEKQAINKARNDLKRASNIIKDLLNFAKPSPPQKKLFDLNTLVKDSINFIPYQPGGDSIKIISDLDEKLPLIMLDPDQIQQVLTNLIINGISAINEKQESNGTLSFSTWFDTNWVYMQIEDNGGGIKSENLEHIFEPFFTTKRSGKGTGLGLSLCDRIINDHAGIISTRSDYGMGTAFLIILPRKTK